LKPFEKLLGNAVLYQLGVLFMHEILNSDNLDNLFLKNSKDQARANILLWAGGFDRDNMYYKKKGAYHDELRKAVDRARKNLKDGLCLSCNNTRVVFSKP